MIRASEYGSGTAFAEADDPRRMMDDPEAVKLARRLLGQLAASESALAEDHTSTLAHAVVAQHDRIETLVRRHDGLRDQAIACSDALRDVTRERDFLREELIGTLEELGMQGTDTDSDSMRRRADKISDRLAELRKLVGP